MSKISQTLKVLIRSRSKNFFTGEVYSVSSKNEKGPFDVLPQHAQFVTLLTGNIVLDKGLPTEKTIEVDKGVLNVLGDKIDVYVGV